MKINYKITTECPARCKCCKERLDNYKKNYSNIKFDIQVCKKIIDLILECGDKDNSVSITGGEPSILEHLPEVVKMFTNEGIRVGVDTNGWNVTDDWLKKMELAGLDYILFSFYSKKRDTYNKLRESEDSVLFDKAVKALQALRRLKTSNSKISVRQQVTILKDNYIELPDLLKMAIDYKFDTLSTAYFISASENEVLALNHNDINYFKTNIVKKMRKILSEIDLSDEKKENNDKALDNFFVFGEQKIDKIAHGYYRSKGCMCNQTNRLVVYPNGDVVPCTGYDYMLSKTSDINILKLNYKQIMQSPLFSNFWSQPFNLCERCSNGYQIWLDL